MIRSTCVRRDALPGMWRTNASIRVANGDSGTRFAEREGVYTSSDADDARGRQGRSPIPGDRDMRLVVRLAGGLGNQLFQYATGRAIATRSGAELALDPVSGFARDRRFRREFELGGFPIAAGTATRLERFLAGLDGLARPLLGRRRPIRRMPWGHVLRENSARFIPEVGSFRMACDAWLRGYWQSPRYFDEFASSIRAELEPPAPRDPRMLGLGRELEGRDAVAVGVRLYEESPDPGANARSGRVKSVAEQAEAVHELLRKHRGAVPYVFCTHRSPALEALRMPAGTTFVTESDGFRGAVPNLWLLVRCRHHVFNNSSFYWWGAWLSEGRRSGPPGAIVAADNFINADCLPPRWGTF
jgi:hypothetical protein